MIVEIEFKNGDRWEVRPLYIADYCQYVATEDAYYILPCKDILVGRVSPEEFQNSQREAKMGAPIGASDIGRVLGAKPKICWKEVKSDN